MTVTHLSSSAVGRVLLVDGEPLGRAVMSRALSHAGYCVTSRAGGVAGLEALMRDEFDVVVSDVSMPDLDGLGFLRAVHERGLEVPVILIANGPTLDTAIDAVEQGASEYLVKPVPPVRLLASVARAAKFGALARLKRDALVSTGFRDLVDESHAYETSFEHALGSVWMACQPIVRAVDGGVHGYEVLVRSTELRLEDASSLLRAADRLARLPDLGATIRARVAELIASGELTGTVYMNLHPAELFDDALLDPKAPLSRYAPRIVLEITERASLEGLHGLLARIRSLRKMGYRIAVDDLGAGYSGLTSFVLLTPDVVKLDMSLVRGLDRDPFRQKLVASMTRLCRDLEILVIAEGVETEGERDAASLAGCQLLQGFFLGRPPLAKMA